MQRANFCANVATGSRGQVGVRGWAADYATPARNGSGASRRFAAGCPGTDCRGRILIRTILAALAPATDYSARGQFSAFGCAG